MDLKNLQGSAWNANLASPNPLFEQNKSEVSKFEDSMIDPRFNEGKFRELMDVTRGPNQRALIDSPSAVKKQTSPHIITFSANITHDSPGPSPTRSNSNSLLSSPGSYNSPTHGEIFIHYLLPLIHMYIYSYIYTCTHMCTHKYIYIYIYRRGFHTITITITITIIQ